MYKLLSPIARAWVFIVLIVLVLGMFAGMQVFVSQITNLPGMNPAPALPDTRFYYTSSQLTAVLDSIGPSGRLIYMHLHLVDMIYPFVYGLLFALAVVFSWGVRGGAVRTASVLAIVPIVGALSDYTENICIRIVSAGISVPHPFAASLAGFATAMKWSFMALTILAIVAGIVFSIVQRRLRTT